MRAGVFVLLSLIFASLAVCADEVLPILKVGSDIYSNVTITTVTPTDIYFTSAKGMGNAKLKNLDPALQRHFKFDAVKVGTEEKMRIDAHNQNQLPVEKQTIDLSNAKAVMDDAIIRVQTIVNQPVRQLPLTPDMNDVQISKPGWFHPGAIKPAFSTVDIRGTQDVHYAEHAYITSDANPGVVFPGPEIEFNSMTKYFYLDRSLPKKRLTEAEMLEINRLYRIIGKCESVLSAGEATASPASPAPLHSPIAALSFASLHKKEILIGAAVLVVVLVGIRLFAGGRAEA